jgi:hypothetical protein
VLPPTKTRGPRKKFRGKRRRLRQLQATASRFSLELRDEVWWSMCHEHLDWTGNGNRRPRLRLAYVSALLTMLSRAAQQLESAGRAFQIFLSLDVDDAAMDALFVHAPSPGSASFPYIANTTVWGDPDIESALMQKTTGLELRAGHMRWSDGDDRDRHVILIYAPRFGVPIESFAAP